MKVGMLTSWNTRCGISEYSRYLVTAMRRLPDVEVTVFGSKNYDDYKIGEDEDYVVPTFGVLPWNKHGDHTFDVDSILGANLDVLHVQYEVVLYNQANFYSLLSSFPGLKVITYHDNCIPVDFPYYEFNLAYTHRENVGVGERYLLPFGIEDKPPVVKTFGLGRSRADIIREICERNGWVFESSFGGEGTWLPTEELTAWLRDSDAIVLYYDDVAAAGSSQAARTAIGTRRPVILNDVTWFKGVEGAYEFVRTPEELEYTLQQLLENPVITAYSWDKLAKGIIEDYLANL